MTDRNSTLVAFLSRLPFNMSPKSHFWGMTLMFITVILTPIAFLTVINRIPASPGVTWSQLVPIYFGTFMVGLMSFFQFIDSIRWDLQRLTVRKRMEYDGTWATRGDLQMQDLWVTPVGWRKEGPWESS